MIYLTISLLFALCLYPEVIIATTQGGTDPTNGGLGSLSTIVAVLVALSVASERLVEIIKGWIPFLNKSFDEPDKEGIRKAILQIMAVVSGIVTALLAQTAIRSVLPDFKTIPHILALGLLASGGSGFWNSFNTYILELKNLKKELAKQAKSGKLTSP